MQIETDRYLQMMEDLVKQSPTHLERNDDMDYIRIHTTHFIKIIEEIPTLKDSIKILDIGITPNTFAIKRLHPSAEVCALDITNYMEPSCKKFGVKFSTCDLTQDTIPYPDNYFDVIIFTEVLEHLIARPREVLTKIKQVLNPSGKIILTVPNIATISNRTRLLLGESNIAPLDDVLSPQGALTGNGHIHEYSMQEITSILKACDFQISHTEYFTMQPSSKLWFRLPMRLIPSFRTNIRIVATKNLKSTP